jgi:outer membrane protein OmpA-like peptidoglycan-associated protein
MRRLLAGLAAVAAVASWTLSAPAQTLPKFALDRFEPAPAGDRFFAVPSADAGAHGSVRLMLLGDYAYRPLVLYKNDGDDRVGSVVSDQLFLHAAISAGLWQRLVLSLNAPIALVTEGDSPASGGLRVSSPSGAAFGDVRLGARVRLLGEPNGVAELALGGSLWLPTGDRDRYAGENRTRGMPQLILSGEAGMLAYAVQGGIVVRKNRVVLGTKVRNEAAFGAAVGLLLADKKLTIGPEFYGTTTFANAFDRDAVNAEAILGARYRVGPVVLGGGVGPGLTRGLGTPTLRALLSVTVAPEPEAPLVRLDRDHDGIFDEEDACPDTAGLKSPDPGLNGCPDGDEDGIFDRVDACPEVPGVRSKDPKKNGCPADKDGDGILDKDDACVDVPGVENEDPKKNGCPPDRDGDGVIDDKDACPDIPGVESDDPEKNGCPGDTDGDGIRDDKDACPQEKGKPDPDPKKNGCPSLVRVTKKEIVILEKVQFKTASDVILPASDELLTQVANVLREHPEIKKIEVQGHTDNRGGAAYNQKLSERRAKSVVKWLTARGEIDANRLDAKGYGMDQPVSENTTEEGRAMNRRVQFKIISFDRPSEEKAE